MVLRSVLFLAYITDISVGVDSSVSCFADDTRISRTVTSEDDAHQLQRDLDNVYSWAIKNNMNFNDEKFKLLKYEVVGGSGVRQLYSSPDGSEIERVPSLRDLGVTMTNNAKFDEQVKNVVKKARKMLGWLLRTFKTRDPAPMLTLYRAVVLPHAEYCCQLWSPTTLGAMRKLEAIQRSFTSRLTGMGGKDYWQRLKS